MSTTFDFIDFKCLDIGSELAVKQYVDGQLKPIVNRNTEMLCFFLNCLMIRIKGIVSYSLVKNHLMKALTRRYFYNIY